MGKFNEPIADSEKKEVRPLPRRLRFSTMNSDFVVICTELAFIEPVIFVFHIFRVHYSSQRTILKVVQNG